MENHTKSKHRAASFFIGVAALALYPALQFFLSLAGAFVIRITGHSMPEEGPRNLLLTSLYMAATVLTVCIYFAVLKRRRLSPVEAFSLRSVPARGVLVYVALGIVVSPGVAALLQLLPLPASVLAGYGETVSGMDKGWLGMLALALVASIGEELICRGIVLNQFKKAMPVWAAVLVQVLFFGLLHGNWLQGISGFISGLIMGWLAAKTNSVLPPILMHMVNNAFAFSGLAIPLGPVATLVISLGVSALGIAVIIRLYKGGPCPAFPT